MSLGLDSLVKAVHLLSPKESLHISVERGSLNFVYSVGFEPPPLSKRLELISGDEPYMVVEDTKIPGPTLRLGLGVVEADRGMKYVAWMNIHLYTSVKNAEKAGISIDELEKMRGRVPDAAIVEHVLTKLRVESSAFMDLASGLMAIIDAVTSDEGEKLFIELEKRAWRVGDVLRRTVPRKMGIKIRTSSGGARILCELGRIIDVAVYDNDCVLDILCGDVVMDIEAKLLGRVECHTRFVHSTPVLSSFINDLKNAIEKDRNVKAFINAVKSMSSNELVKNLSKDLVDCLRRNLAEKAKTCINIAIAAKYLP